MPSSCLTDGLGVLRTAKGVAVAYRDDGVYVALFPSSSSTASLLFAQVTSHEVTGGQHGNPLMARRSE